jgi:peptidoglycan pentaglycine glycine transferase (the first glycine)
MAEADAVPVRRGDLSCRLSAALAPDERDAFAAFVAGSPAASHQQMPVWPDIVPASPLHRYRFLTCRRGGALVTTDVLRFPPVLPGRHLVNLPRGPVVHDPGLLGEGLEALAGIARKAGGISVTVNPRWSVEDMEATGAVLAHQGFQPLPARDQKMHTATGLIDLAPEPDAILAGLKQRCRRSIRTGEKSGLVLRRLTRADDLGPYATFWRDFTRRKGFDTGGIPDLPGQLALTEHLGGAVVVAEHGGECVGLLTSVRHGDRGYFLAGASSDRHPAIPKTYVTLWHSLLIMREMGCRAYDLAGMPEHEPRDEDERNRMQFKQAFNPRHVRLCARHIKVLRPVEHAVCFDLLRGLRQLRGRVRHLADALPAGRRADHAH